MQRRISAIFVLSLLLMAFIATSVLAASAPVKKERRIIDRSVFLSFPDNVMVIEGGTSDLNPLRSSSYGRSSNAFTGATVGQTWYDYQHNGTMGRMIAWGPYTTDVDGRVIPDVASANNDLVNFSWMGLPGPSMDARKYYYNYYNATAGTFNATGQVGLQTSDEFAGYVGIDVTPEGLTVYGGHNNPTGNLPTPSDIYQPEIKRVFNVGSTLFPYAHRVPDSVAVYGTSATSQSVIWPKFGYQAGTDNVLHIIAQVSAPAAADPQSIYYFRKVTTDNLITGIWDDPPYVIDTVYDLSHDIACQPMGDKIALIWTGNLPEDGDCETCSGESNIHVQWDNDVYYQISDNQGVTFAPRVNITKYANGVPGFRAYTDLSSLIDHEGNLHIIWSGVYWPANPLADGWSENCVLFHYSEDWPLIRKIHNADYVANDCGPGAWNINVSKMQISECDNKLYAMWVQFNELKVDDDCSSRADGGNGDVDGSANGELWLSISADNGLTWDAARNLTNTYTPNCTAIDSITSTCESENWASMARYGRQDQTGEDWTGGPIIDPSSGYTGDMFLDVQYIADIDPGGIVQNEGIWTVNDVRWFRIPCVEPIDNPVLSLSWRAFEFPGYVKPGVQLDSNLTIENLGNSVLTYSIATVELNGDAGWLGESGFSGSVPSGLLNVENGTVHLNNAGAQATEFFLHGLVIFSSNAPSSPDTVIIDLLVADTVVASTWDTLFSGCLALSISNTGNYGQAGADHMGLSWVNDCDTNAVTYLYDGSPLLMWDTGGGYVYQNDMFGQTYLDASGFRALYDTAKGYGDGCVKEGDFYNTAITNVFTTFDSSIAMRQIFYAPDDPADPTNCDFVIQVIEMWSNDGAVHNDLRVGAGYDWDIPADTGSQNTSGTDFARNLIYMSGAEFHDDDNPDSCGNVDQPDCPCQDSDARFGGVAFIESTLGVGGAQLRDFVSGAYTGENDTAVYPAGNFVPDELWAKMGESGFAVVHPDSIEDLHMVIVYDSAFDLSATDVVRFFSIIATVENGTAADLSDAVDRGLAFYNTHGLRDLEGICSCCKGITGDYNNDGGALPDVSDLLYLVDYMFLPPGSAPAPVCMDESDVNGDLGSLPDVSDLLYLVDYMFLPPGSAPAPVACH